MSETGSGQPRFAQVRRATQFLLAGLALLGLLASLTTHAFTLFGIDPQAKFPAVMMLHVGIIVLGIPTSFFANHKVKYGEPPTASG